MSEEIPKKVEKFFSNYRLRVYDKGRVLIFNGETTECIYYMVSGKVKEYDVTARGDEIVLNIFRPPAYFPMSLAFNQTTNHYIYEAETDIEVRQAPISEVVEFVKNNPDVMLDLLKRVYIGVDGILGRMAHLMASNAKNRLVYEIILEAKRFGKKQKDGGYEIILNEKDLGARAGLSRETISREINKLKTKKIIVVDNKTILINDLDQLEKTLSDAI